MITIDVLPPEEYPSKPVPAGHYLVKLDGLESCAMIVGCTPEDEQVLETLTWTRATLPHKLNRSGTECLVLHLRKNEVPSEEASRFLARAVRNHPYDPIYIAVKREHRFSVIPYREE